MNKTFKIISGGGIGEALLVTPALRAIKQEYPSSKTHIYCLTQHHFDVYRHNPAVDKLYLRLRRSFWKHPIWVIREFLFAPKEYIRPFYGRLLPTLVYEKHASRVVADIIGVSLHDEKLDLFLTAEEEKRAHNLLKPYSCPVVIHTIASYTKNKNWIQQYWLELVRRNPYYNFVQIGKADEEKVDGCIDCRGTSIREQFSIIKAAKGFVGIDSVFAHAASAVQTPAVVLFGASTPVLWGNSGSINLYEGVRCSPCIEALRSDPCPYGHRCMSLLTVEKVEKALRAAMSGKLGSVAADSTSQRAIAV